jgi:predicted dehydrogenase/threonine dehydrogenase-like Zn-dependent dehydrogenase
MKQVFQDPRSGKVALVDVPPPVLKPGRVLVRTSASLISSGTERLTVESGRKSLLSKARERPDLVQEVFQKAKREGLQNTFNAVRSKLGALAALGYSAAGVIVRAGDGVADLHPGDAVACAGTGYASHAEMLSVPRNLCARMPEGLSFEQGAFGTLGAIALQGVRLAAPTLGESIVVIGLGLIGQLTVQLLRANGCRVFGIDLDSQRIDLAGELGADAGCLPDDDAEKRVIEWSCGRGADAVLIAAATASNQPVALAGEISRLKGRVVAVGLVGLEVPRQTYYQKELSLNISLSYGPGRYDPDYEERGRDYPFAYVRWTEGRNLEAFLDLVGAGNVNVDRLITHRFPVEEAESAYRLITGETNEPSMGVLLQYDTQHPLARRIELSEKTGAAAANNVRVGLIGAGSYAKRMLLPNLKTAGVMFETVATASGVSAREIGEKYGFHSCASGADEVIDDQSVNLVVIATRHDTHAELARRALERGHHVFVEKPLAMNEAELDEVLAAAGNSNGRLMVGFNRRFSSLAQAAKDFFSGGGGPLSISYRVSAGRIPRTHWIQDPREGGGRIIGEVCHFVDLMQFLTGAVTTRVYAEAISSPNQEIVDDDSIFVTLRFSDGSNGSIAYLAEGDPSVPKERIEVFSGGKTFVLDDFRSATMHERGKQKRHKLRSQDKGQADEMRAVCEVVRQGKLAPIALEDLAATTRATFAIRRSLRTGLAIEVLTFRFRAE